MDYESVVKQLGSLPQAETRYVSAHSKPTGHTATDTAWFVLGRYTYGIEPNGRTLKHLRPDAQAYREGRAATKMFDWRACGETEFHAALEKHLTQGGVA